MRKNSDISEPGSPTSRAYEAPIQGAVCIVLAAGFPQVEREIEMLGGPLVGVPKALLPVAGKPMLDHWWEYIAQNRSISDIFVVCNALKYKHFERWATAKGINMSRIVNNGATAPKHSRGVLRDVVSGLQRARHELGNSIEGRDVIIFAGDSLFFKDFDLDRILHFRRIKEGSLLLYYSRRPGSEPSKRGMCKVDSGTHEVLGFSEKPAAGQTGFDYPFISPLFYILEPRAWTKIVEFTSQQMSLLDSEGTEPFSCGRFLSHAIESLKLPFWGMRMPGAFFLVGAGAGYDEYLQLDNLFATQQLNKKEAVRIKKGAYARVGLMGNPSDGFNGKTISMTIRNFWASVELWESERLELLPHPLYDPSSFSGLQDLHFIGRREGFYGGTRLLMATCKKFQELCTSSGIALPRKNFTVKYDTNIPRQVGLAGSSAIVTSLLMALMEFYDLTEEHISKEKQPNFVLSVESELGIQAGLQDRVVQVYRGVVFMDFSAEHMDKHGHGKYEVLSDDVFEWLCTLPFFLAYEADPSDSGKIHTNVRGRWDAKEPEVIEGMQHFAGLTVKARDALIRKDHAALCDLMDENFSTRRRIYGDQCLGKKNLRMIEICNFHGAAAKFPGSGGAVLGLCRPPPRQEGSDGYSLNSAGSSIQQVCAALEAENIVFCPLDPVQTQMEF